MTAPLINDAGYDYVPIESGSELSMGDNVVWAVGYQLVVDEIATAPNDGGGTTYTFTNIADSLSVSVDHPPETGDTGYAPTQYIVTAHPPVGTKYTNTGDGSRWVFQASETYRCFVAGSTYPAGTVLTRALIVGGMAEESS